MSQTSTEVATRPQTGTAKTYRIPRTEYVYVTAKGSQASQGGSYKYIGGQDRLRDRINLQANVSVPKGFPRWLGSRNILAGAWVVSMVLVGFDEWHNLGVLPRPARLWDTSIVFGLLALVSVADVLVPLVNALAIGYAIMLLWQYYSGSGQFVSTKGASS